MKLIDNTVNMFMKKKFETSKVTEVEAIKLYYEMQMTDNYKEEEKQLEAIVTKNIAPRDHSKEVKLMIYYKNKKLKQLFIKNCVTSSK